MNIFGLYADHAEWETVPGAAGYHFQVVDSKGKIVQDEKKLKINRVELTVILPGKYKYKVGVVDKSGNAVFADWVEFDIEDSSLGDGKKYPVHLEWDTVPEAKAYFLEITTPSGKLVKALKTKTNQKDLTLKVGKYRYRTAYEKKVRRSGQYR